MKAWIISDTHIGCRNGNKMWDEIIRNYFDEFFFPIVEKEAEQDDILIHLGDVFDNRQNIGVEQMSYAVSLFERFAETFGHVFVLCGNHDVKNNGTNETTSLDCIRNINGVTVFKYQTEVSVRGVTLNMVPWESDPNKLLKHLSKKCDYTFCHADILGATMNASNVKSEQGVDIANLKNAKNIFSGHIHHKHKYKCVEFVGSPYAMDFNDSGNEKCLLSIDLNNGNKLYRKNKTSPEFAVFDYNEIDEMPFGRFKDVCKNKFIRISVDANILSGSNMQRMLGLLETECDIKNIEIRPVGSSSDAINTGVAEVGEYATLDDMLDKYIDAMLECSDAVREKVRTISKKIIHGEYK